LIVDGSQSVPHFAVDVTKLWCDAMFFTGHKVYADSGIWVLWAKEELLIQLKPIFSWGGAIGEVKQKSFTHSKKLPDKFEPGTPNLSGAVSMLRAFEYIESIGWYKKMEEIEKRLVEYSLIWFSKIPEIRLIGSSKAQNRVWVFTFAIEWIHSFDISDSLADNNICVRAGQHCAEPFMDYVGQTHTCRMSLQIYNTRQDLDLFFEVLTQAIIQLK
jgi:cysteine desulfurase/selenocysteine lyase